MKEESKFVLRMYPCGIHPNGGLSRRMALFSVLGCCCHLGGLDPGPETPRVSLAH